jgi:uncharacterized protein (TIGR02231 family)
MKLPHPILLILLGCPALLRAASVDSHISAATVYADRAVITRTAELDLPQGDNVLVFEHLPANLAEQSLQFSGHGTASTTILDVNAQTTFVDTSPSARVKELEDQINDQGKQIRTLEDRMAILGDERDFVKRMLTSETQSSPGPSEGAHGPGARPSLDDWQKLYAYSEEALGKIAAELRTLDDQHNDLAGKKGALRQQLDSLRNQQGKSVKDVTVRLLVATAGKLEVELKYAVPGATWAPSYNARLHAEERTVELEYFGLVRNMTGEDWKEIALTLSTARPSLGGGAPELAPWVVDEVRQADEPTVMSKFVAEKSSVLAGTRKRENADIPTLGANSSNQQFISDRDLRTMEMEVLNRAAVVEANATSATFKIPATVSVPANNSVQKVSIISMKLAAKLEYEATPKLSEAAFLSAAASNGSDYPLLAGAMNTFLDDTFIAASRLKTVMPGEKFELHLGADEGIAIKRRLVNRFAENTGLTNNGRRVTYEYLVTITNNKKTEERVMFKEPLPVSRQEKIEVKLIAPEEDTVGTKEAPKEVTREEDGKLVWRLDLKPGEKREVPIKFSISYPADLRVSGVE